ncbi:MAG: hypothetical protein H0X36_12215 [Sphingomonadaceae bacterium]|nr:hypothetical protein [Sphingomonadaceae bacterium]
MTRSIILTIAALGFTPASLSAQTAPAVPATAAPAATPAPTVGVSIYDSAGVEIGKVESVSGGAAVVAGPTGKFSLAVNSLSQSPKGLAIAMTKADLDAAAKRAQAAASGALAGKLVAGTAVSSVDGAAKLGTIKAADAQFVTLTTAKGDVKLPVAGFSADASGKVMLGMTAAQFDTAVNGVAVAPMRKH